MHGRRGEARGPLAQIASTAVFVTFVFVGCAPTTTLPTLVDAATGSPSVPSTTATPATVPTATPSSTELPSSSPLPKPGGTCSASQFVPGKATSGYEFSTFFTKVVSVTQHIRNAGVDCVLALPKVIGLAGPTGVFDALDVPNGGREVCSNGACRYVYPTSFKVKTGQLLSVVLRDSWSDSRLLAGAGMTAPPCADAISDVTRAEFPLASGTLEIDWDTVWQEVCSSPASVSVTVEN